MSRIDEMIKELCPNGIEYKKIGEIAEIARGVRVVRSQLSEVGKYPVYQNSLTPMGYYDNKNCNANTAFVIAAGAAGEIGYCYTDFWAADDCYYFNCSSNLSSRYLFHVLLWKQSSIKSRVRRASIPRLSRVHIEQLIIPVPPLPIQEEIVRILDSFTKLEAELEAELEARRKQYEFYRNKLLSLKELKRSATEGGVKLVSLGEIGTFVRGNGLQKKDFVDIGIGCIHYGQIYTYYGTHTDKTKSFVAPELAEHLCKVAHGDLIIACTSENIDDVCKSVTWLGDADIVTGGHACVFKHKQNPKYIAYYFQTEAFAIQKKKYARGAKVIDIKVDDIAKITIPLPSLDEQARVVSVLDKFDALVNDLTSGLPAEIATRRRQYEHYRERLLAFNKIA